MVCATKECNAHKYHGVYAFSGASSASPPQQQRNTLGGPALLHPSSSGPKKVHVRVTGPSKARRDLVGLRTHKHPSGPSAHERGDLYLRLFGDVDGVL